LIERPNAQLDSEKVEGIWKRLKRIKQGYREDSQGEIARDFGVSKKTISRISTQETWRDVTERYDYRLLNEQRAITDIPTLPSVPAELADLHDDLTQQKTLRGLSTELPLHWGWYEAWDGLHGIATDGIVLWEDLLMVELARRAHASGISDHPIYGLNAHELPTFTLIDIMCHPLGEALRVEETFSNGVAKLATADGFVVYLQDKFVRLAKDRKLSIYSADNDPSFVFLTKFVSSRYDPLVEAAIAAMEEE
jgi:hypothetical protein